VHHFDGAAGETEGHGPQGALTRPVGDLVERGTGVILAACSVPTSHYPEEVTQAYSAYCMAPFFPSWLGSGTSRRACFIGGGVPGLPATRPGVCIGAAGVEAVEERNAAVPARYGNSAVAVLAAHKVNSGRLVMAWTHLAAPLRRQTLSSIAC
jgi:hypothetical protein